MVVATITGFMNAQRSQNEAFSTRGNTYMNSSNTGVKRYAAATVNLPAHMGGQNTNNRDDVSKISYNSFGSITNWLPRVISKVTFNEVSVVWGWYSRIASSVYRMITSNQRKIHNVNYREEIYFLGRLSNRYLQSCGYPLF